MACALETTDEKLSLIARDYQVELFQSAMKENIIVYLPTGSGKTFIAALLIKEHAHEVTEPLSSGGKRTVFLVPTVVLAIQQAAYLRRHTALKVKEFYGSMGVDMWKKDKWQTEFENNNVLVMTAQVFVDILNHAFFQPDQLNLLVFDECHAAVKDSPMKQVLSKMKTYEDKQRPKILGLTAALFRKRCKPGKIGEVIKALSETMGCVVKSPTDVEGAYCSSTKPCEVILQYRKNNSALSDDANHLSYVIRNSTESLIHKFLPLYGEEISKDASAQPKMHVDKVDILLEALKDIMFTLEYFGSYGTYRCTQAYTRVLEGAKNSAKSAQFKLDLDRALSHCSYIRELCNLHFKKHSKKDGLLLFVQPRVIRLLEVIRNFSPDAFGSEGKNKMCGIVFVERRCMANVLYHFLKDIREHDSSLEFMNPLFIMGLASGRNSSIKETLILNMKQKEIMGRFREGHCNLLVSTSVLEEGIDIPACNLIVRFDQIKTYCDYVQTKGRARSAKSFYFILVSEDETEKCMDDMAQFHSIEQQLLSTENFESDRESALNNLFYQIIPPYTPFGIEGPRITLQGSISLVTRYCSQLSSDKDAVLLPQWTIVELKESLVDPNELARIKKVIASVPPGSFPSSSKFYSGNPSKSPSTNGASAVEFFQCRLILPLNSPLREEVIGDVMPTKRLAKRAAALKACTLLHELKEFDDIHLLPVPRLSVIEDEEEALESDPKDQACPLKKTDVFYKRIPSCFSGCQPLPEKAAFVYSIDFALLEPGSDESKYFYPFAVETKFGILSSKTIPSICPFPLITRAGTFQVTLKGVDSVLVKDSHLEKLEKFHRFIFEDVIFLGKRQLEFNLELSKTQCFIIPLQTETHEIDFRFVEKVITSPKIDWGNPPSRDQQFEFNLNEFVDAVVVPWYNPLGALTPYYVDQISDLTPLSKFPKENFQTYAKYYLHKYKLPLTNLHQRLLLVSREITGKNFLLPRKMQAHDLPMHLVPELCHVHPIPGSLWKQLVWIPSVLHRLNRMLAAEELRLEICKGTNTGICSLPGNIDLSSVWSPIRTVERKSYRGNNSRSPPNPKPLLSTLGASVMVDGNSLDSDIWMLDYDKIDKFYDKTDSIVQTDADKKSDGHQEESMLKEAVRASLSSYLEEMLGVNYELPPEKPAQSPWSAENYTASFDSIDPSSISKFGPSPGLILEALTVSKTHEGFDMERLETMGDSILKLIISIYVYGQTTNTRSDEGRLTMMRTNQINNKHLFQLGMQKKIGELIVAQGIDIIGNFLPPGYVPPESDTGICLHVQQLVSVKNIADCMEAIIGVYLIQAGIKSAYSVMNWMGLRTIPKDVNTFNALNGFPILSPPSKPTSVQESEQIECLYCGLNLFEQLLRYSFKNKTLLIEALTHPSYLANRITGCYQRLEFLGDAVLDYLVTRFYYDHPCQYSPAVLTDLRSAVVNNQTFAVLAVKNGFHLYMKHLSSTLNAVIDRFVQAQEENNHRSMHDYFVLEETNDANEQMASNVDVPKVLGDLFESVAGAIFVDSGMSLDAVWKSYLPFLRSSLDNFSIETPIPALRALHEYYPNLVEFRKPETLSDGRLSVTIEIPNVRAFKGAGGNSKAAKSAAAKYALSVLNAQRS